MICPEGFLCNAGKLGDRAEHEQPTPAVFKPHDHPWGTNHSPGLEPAPPLLPSLPCMAVSVVAVIITVVVIMLLDVSSLATLGTAQTLAHNNNLSWEAENRAGPGPASFLPGRKGPEKGLTSS